MRRFVFVPIFGDDVSGHTEEQWLQAPHVKAWGFLDGDDFIPIHTEPACEAVELNHAVCLFEGEIAALVDVPENSSDLPDAVCVALAKLALVPELVEAN